MTYSAVATSTTPVLIIYLLDISGSMSQMLGDKRRVEIVSDALQEIATEMVARSTKGEIVAPRYRLAIYAYESQVHDILGGIKTIDQFVRDGVPEFAPRGSTNSAAAFLAAEQLLLQELPYMSTHPAPLICHMTDGEYQGDDPTPIVQRIMGLGTNDGNVLVENIFISDKILKTPVDDAFTWAGVTSEADLASDYARALLRMSSPLPDSYRGEMQEFGYTLNSAAPMMFPAQTKDLIRMAFTMSGATPVA
ncbi:MAG TPA: vWA domain-containing protein [Aggregatilineales bacterium]|nr:VWA domain-containing protein [Anaerolineales bacterium]HRE49385.1 vWA domain-containing protein [Aggregatilineales bacterium]